MLLHKNNSHCRRRQKSQGEEHKAFEAADHGPPTISFLQRSKQAKLDKGRGAKSVLRLW